MLQLADIRMLRLIPHSLKTPFLQRAFTPALMVGAVTPNKSNNSASFIHTSDISFLFHFRLILGLLNGVANVLFHILQPVRQVFHVLTNLLGGYLCVDLGCLYVGVTQKSADGFNRYSVG